MQKVIIAGSLAVLASGVVIPKEAMKKKFMTKLTTADMSRTSASLASATPRVTTQDAVVSTLRGGSKIRGKQGKGKGKGRDDDENGDAEGSTRKFFEYSVGPSDACSSDERFYTVGFELGVCQNYVDKLDNGYGEPRSHRWVQGENGGAIMQEAFLSHNCMGDVAASMQLSTEELGFPTGYVVGDCADFGDYYGKVAYYDERHSPTYDALYSGYGIDQMGCQEGTHFEYEYERVSSGCQEDEEGAFYTVDMSNCESGSVTFNWYSDNTCTTLISSDVDTPQQCLFDLEYFLEGSDQPDYTGYFQYDMFECHVASTGR